MYVLEEIQFWTEIKYIYKKSNILNILKEKTQYNKKNITQQR